jgi:hypothetical protein
MKNLSLFSIVFLMGIFLLSGCSKDDPILEPTQSDGYVLSVITDVSNSSGILIPYDSMPDATVDPGNVSGFSYADVRSAGYAYKNAIFENTNSAGDPGIQKLTLTPDGDLVEDGFIVDGVISAVKNDDEGYYWDPNLNAKAIQTFNPTSMVRTGEIDLSAQLDPYLTDSVTSISFNWFMELAADKLYTMVTFEDANTVPVHDSSLVVVINTITNEFEAMAIHPEFFMFGYYGQPNIEYTGLGSDGNLYLAAWGGIDFNIKGTILRIPAGQTEFDQSFEIKLDDYVGGPAMMYGGSCYYNGKLYVRLKETPVKPDFSNFNTIPDIYPYEIDIATGTVTKIEGTPGSNHNSIHGPFLYQEKIYFPASNPDYQGYFVYDPAAGGPAKEIFALTSGVPSQLYILKD